MIIDAKDCPKLDLTYQAYSSQILIIGSGLSSLCIASDLLHKGFKVMIVESGEEFVREETDKNDQAYLHRPDGIKIDFNKFLYESRPIQIGGAANLWGGKCGEFEKKDFMAKPWSNISSWPISHAELKPYYKKAADFLKIPALGNRTNLNIDPDLIITDDITEFTTGYRCFSPITKNDPRQSLAQCKKTVFSSDNCTLISNATAVEILGNGTSAKSVICRTLNGKEFIIHCEILFLCAGGIENPRLLMSSEKLLANISSKSIGCFYSGHLVFKYLNKDSKFAIKKANFPVSFYQDRTPGKIHGVFSLSRKTLLQERMLDVSVSISHENINNPTIYFLNEQKPEKFSGIQLLPQRDLLDRRCIRLDWAYTEYDFDNLKKGIHLFNEFLVSNNFGELDQCDLNLSSFDKIESSRHHIGMTRMGISSDDGVVDKNGKVFGLDNVWVVGTSVFPSSALPNPTLTMLALAHVASKDAVAVIS